MDEVIKISNNALNIQSITGFTNLFKNYLMEKFSKLGYKVNKKQGLLIVQSYNNPTKICILAHLDRIGFIGDSNQCELSTLYLKSNKKVDDRLISRIFNRYVGAILFDKNGKKSKLFNFNFDSRNNRLYFYLDKALSGPCFSINNKLTVSNGWISGQLDNVYSIAVLLDILEKNKIDGTFLFSDSEEISTSYKYLLSFLSDPQYQNTPIIVLDTCLKVSEKRFQKGCILIGKREDDVGFNMKLHQKILLLSNKLKIPYITEQKNSFSELYSIIKMRFRKISGITIRLPRKNYHTGNETTTLKCCQNYYRLIKKILKSSF